MPNDEEGVKGKVIKLLADASGAVKPPRRRRREAAPLQSIQGSNNIQAGRDVHIKTERLVHRPKVTVVPGYGVIDEKQKVRLLSLADHWVEVNNLARRTKLTLAGARGAMNRKAGVTSYHLIPLDMFTTVERWLLQQIARVNHTPTARRVSPTWRTARIKAIQARCNERGFQDRRKIYMRDRFGAESMTAIDDAQLEQLYSAVMGW